MAWLDPSLLSGFPGAIKMETLMSFGSACLTGYFWLTKIRRENARLRLIQPAAFRADRRQCSRVPGKEKATWYGEIFLANPATSLQTVIAAKIELFWKGQWIEGKWVLEKKDDLPWAVEPLRVFTRNLGLSFDVDEGTAPDTLQENHRIRLTLTTLDGRKVVQEIETHGPAALACAA
jgi:hypothetical protein